MSKTKQFEKYINQTGSWFTCVTHDLSLADDIKKTILDFPFWAWIYHEPDRDDGTPHVHFLVRTNGTRKIKHIAEKFNIEPNFIQIVRQEVGLMRYFMHLDSDDKIKYDVNDVHTNSHADFRKAKEGEFKPSVIDLYNNFTLLSKGEIKPIQFIQEHITDIDKMNFSQKIRTLQIIKDTYMSSVPPTLT